LGVLLHARGEKGEAANSRMIRKSLKQFSEKFAHKQKAKTR
jgi:hypothetical protein